MVKKKYKNKIKKNEHWTVQLRSISETSIVPDKGERTGVPKTLGWQTLNSQIDVEHVSFCPLNAQTFQNHVPTPMLMISRDGTVLLLGTVPMRVFGGVELDMKTL